MNKTQIKFDTDADIHHAGAIYCSACIGHNTQKHDCGGRLHTIRSIQNFALLDRRCDKCGHVDTVKERDGK